MGLEPRTMWSTVQWDIHSTTTPLMSYVDYSTVDVNPLCVLYVVITVKQICSVGIIMTCSGRTEWSSRMLKWSYFWTSNYILTVGNVEMFSHNVVCMFSSSAIIFYFPSCYLVLFMFLFSFHEQIVEFVRRHKRALPDKKYLSSRFFIINSLPKKMDATSFPFFFFSFVLFSYLLFSYFLSFESIFTLANRYSKYGSIFLFLFYYDASRKWDVRYTVNIWCPVFNKRWKWTKQSKKGS